MADRGSCGLGPRLDIQQLCLEAQHRWLRPVEICEILCNYQKFKIASEPPNKPSSGSLFLFDRKVLRYFRKDGHNWRKKKDGKTVKEAHEKLKVGSIDVLHCYYAHGEANENFQRRSYWMLEQEFMHIVFVHYLEIKGNRTNNSPSSSFADNNKKEPSGNTDSTSPTSTLSSFCEDVDSADSHQASSGYNLLVESPQMYSPVMEKVNAGPLNSHFWPLGSDNHEGQSSLPGIVSVSYVHGDRPGNNENGNFAPESQCLASQEAFLEQYAMEYNNVPSHGSTNYSPESISAEIGESVILGESFAHGDAAKEEFDVSLPIQSNFQIPFGKSSLCVPEGSMDPSLDLELAFDLGTRLFEQTTHDVNIQNLLDPFSSGPFQQNEQLQQHNLQMQLTNAEPQHVMQSNSENDILAEGNSKYVFSVKQPLLAAEEGLKKVDSFSRWISRELAEVDDLHTRSSFGISWSTVDCGNVVDDSSLTPSLSQDQLFSINDFTPKCGFTDTETEVHITGTFLKSQQEVAKCHWSCMFGEVEVPAEVLADGILCCYAPPHTVGRVPFYITCSNRFACSEVREFDYLVGSAEDIDITNVYWGNTNEVHLHLQLEKLLSIRSSSPNDFFDGAGEKRNLISKIILLKEEDDVYQLAEPTSKKDLCQGEEKKILLQKVMTEKLYSWLLHRISDNVKGPSVLDDKGQGVLHLAAALGYDWAIKPMITAGVSINFRDVNGWTALHWAAFYGREQTVAILVSLDAAPGALADPSPEFPLGRTAADLASGNGHKGISGFLAESSLTNQLSSLTVNESREDSAPEISGSKAVQTVSERTAATVSNLDVPDDLSLKDTLVAICNATQAATRIYEVFRMQSFREKQLTEYGDAELDLSGERALSLVTAKRRIPASSDGVGHAAAIQIQKKFRGWKKRREFLIIRQRIVKIQAHVRGHQVRKQYRTIIWSVGILEKIILRWRRKGSGLRGFRRDTLIKDSNLQCMPSKEDDYDFLKEGRKQNEERTQKALNRVQSMFHHPEGRAQYRRLLTVLEGVRETNACDMVTSNPKETASFDEEHVIIDSLMEDENFMSMAFE